MGFTKLTTVLICKETQKYASQVLIYDIIPMHNWLDTAFVKHAPCVVVWMYNGKEIVFAVDGY